MARSGTGIVLCLALLAVFQPAKAGGPAQHGENCDGTASCTSYMTHCTTHKCRWPTDPDGIVRVPYWVNTTWLGTGNLTPETAVRAVKAAAKTWERYNPTLDLIYKGTTTNPPSDLDGMMTISWTLPPGAGAGLAWPPVRCKQTCVLQPTADGDILIQSKTAWQWNPCTKACPPVRPQTGNHHEQVRGLFSDEVQDILTHEIGHVLGLGHPYSREDGGHCALTMKGSDCKAPPQGYVSRWRSSLAMGDVLGLKWLYPWECPEPKPGKSGRKAYPKEYRRLCPTIKIYEP